MSLIEATQAEFDTLQAKVAAVKEKIEPLRDQREAIVQRQQAMQPDIDALSAAMQVIYDESDYLALSRQFGRVAQALNELKRGG
jgi:septal ring factor EnvC (AmiA/AmiB activator)